MSLPPPHPDDDADPGTILPGRSGSAGRQESKRAARRAPSLKKRRRRQRLAFIASALTLFLCFGLFGIVYGATRVPLPGEVRNNQSSIIYFADGRNEIARIGAENRTDIRISSVPKPVQQAVLAAENRNYYSESGISPRGIGRAVWANLRGKDLQGGSTITQQYAKNAYLDQQRTFTRKFREIVIAVKLDREYSKDQVLEWYLNTIYFGRGAYGIQAAAETYFGVPASKLTLEQGAVLAASIRSPARYNPQEHPQAARDRWQYVLDGMVTMKWLTPARSAQAKYPVARPVGTSQFNNLAGSRGYIVRQVSKELDSLGYSDDVVRRAGLRVVTSIDKQAQTAAVNAVSSVFRDQPADLRQALVAIDPGTGGIRAYYGGKIGNGALDYASHSYQPGSSMKPYVLAEALTQGISLKSYWDGTSPQEFPDRGAPVYNSGDGRGSQCAHCDLIRSTVLSLNTVYYALTAKVGATKAAELAKAAGIRSLAGKPIDEFINSGKLSNGLGIGQFEVTPTDHAAGFATFAAGGVAHDRYFVEKVVRIDNGEVLYEHKKAPGKRAFSADVAADAGYAMQQVVRSSPNRLDGGRPAAAKTGTAEDPNAKQIGGNGGGNSAAWMCGYTPQLAAVVWVGHDNLKTPLVTKTGRQIYGSGLPGATWKAFMDGALKNQPVKKFPPPAYIGKRNAGNDDPPPPSPRPAPSPLPSTSPTAQPSPTPSPSPTKKPPKCPTFPVCPPPPPPAPATATAPAVRR